MKYIVNYSGGLSSHLAAKRICEEVGSENVTLLFADTKSEDADLYRFLHQGAEQLGAELVRIADGRTIWEVMRDERYLANTRADPCSKILKRKLADRWIKERYTPETCVRVFGYSSCEMDRGAVTGARLRPWVTRFPLQESPTMTSVQVRAEFRLECPDLPEPRLYALGAPHNNCGGLCVKAGQKQFAWALRTIPEKYAEWEREEQKLRDQLGDVAILRDRRGGTTKPMPLSVFRERMTRGVLPFEAPGEDTSCNCFQPEEGE